MTEEEKAEKYVNETFGRTNPIVAMTYINIYLEGHEEGRKEGYEQGYEDCRHYAHDYYKPKWHDLRKDPNDLPNNREEVLLYVKLHDKLEREHVLIGYRDYGDCLGEYCEDWGYVEPTKNCKYDFVDGEEVIAWCELPKFEEE